MSDQTPLVPPEVQRKSTSELVSDVARESREAIETGARLTQEMTELERRTREALDWRKQMERHPWAVLGGAMGVAALLYIVFGPREE